jgi:16S rRNA (guanine966-N2)-methyltransferase
MRIIAGEFRSRQLKSRPGLDTRPTPDRLRETLFNILAPQIEGAVFLDAYAGTGAVGIEALSRGARHCYFLEKSRDAIEVLRENLSELKLTARATVVKGAVQSTLARQSADIVFLDPPYDLDREYRAVLDLLAEDPPPLAIAQHSIHFAMAEAYDILRRTRCVKQGENALSFFAPVAPAAPVEPAEQGKPVAPGPDGA